MPPQARSSQAGPSGTFRRSGGKITNSTAAATAETIPAYEAPQHPLTEACQRKLNLLLNQHPLKPLDVHLRKSIDLLTECAADINEYSSTREEEVQRRRQAARRGGTEDPAGSQENQQLAEQYLADFMGKVNSMTGRMDEHVRKMIDGIQGSKDVEGAMSEAKAISRLEFIQASQQVETRTPTQAAAHASGQEPDDGLPSSMLDVESQEQQNEQRPRLQYAAPSARFREVMDSRKDVYQTLSLSMRYSQHPQYKGFKRAVWDASHLGDDAPVMPHESTWFNDGGAGPAPGTTTGQAGPEDSDDDIAIQRERISTKCPITLQEFVDPVTSHKCPHTFEREAIMSLIGGRGRKVTCPVTGCSHKLGLDDLHADPVLMHRIRRVQNSRRAVRNAMDSDGDVDVEGDGTRGRGIIVDENDGFNELVDDYEVPVRPKPEPSSRRRTRDGNDIS